MPVEVIMPKVDMDMAEGTISHWHSKEGDSVSKGEPLFDIETDKANMEVEAPASGILQQITANDGDVIEIGKCIALIYGENESIVDNTNSNPAAETTQPAGTTAVATENTTSSATPPDPIADDAIAARLSAEPPNGRPRATPLARKTASEQGISLEQVSGSGPRGRISHKDLETAKHSGSSLRARLDELGIAYSTQTVARMRAVIAQRLTQSKTTVPHFYLDIDCNVDKLLDFRREINEANVGRVSVNDLIIVAAAKAMQAVPEANASWAGDEIIQYRDANISVAVAIEGGLLTPVVRKAQEKSIDEISATMTDLASRARQNKLAKHEYQGGSMSISNLGMFGVRRFSAIINPPESMILAIGQAQTRFVADEQRQPVAASVMSVCLSCDHRVVDGAVGARWLQSFQESIENPLNLHK